MPVIRPFYYFDDVEKDDLPNSDEAIARGFANSNAYYIGNQALSALHLEEAELCVEDLSNGKQLCLPLLEHMLVIEDDDKMMQPMMDSFNGSDITNVHKLVAIFAGQLPKTEEVITPIVRFHDQIRSGKATNPELCVQPQTSTFGEPTHCWQTCVDTIRCLTMENVTRETSSFDNNVWVSSQVDERWLFAGNGIGLAPSSTNRELRWTVSPSGRLPNQPVRGGCAAAPRAGASQLVFCMQPVDGC